MISLGTGFDFEFYEGVWIAVSKEESPRWIEDYANAVVGWAKYFAPKRTGRGANSIHKDWNSIRQEWTVGPDTIRYKYMIYQELGTRHMRPHPYLRPALAAAASGGKTPASFV